MREGFTGILKKCCIQWTRRWWIWALELALLLIYSVALSKPSLHCYFVFSPEKWVKWAIYLLGFIPALGFCNFTNRSSVSLAEKRTLAHSVCLAYGINTHQVIFDLGATTRFWQMTGAWVLLASVEQKPGMLLNILQCTGQPFNKESSGLIQHSVQGWDTQL